jgi:hypothetical protein
VCPSEALLQLQHVSPLLRVSHLKAGGASEVEAPSDEQYCCPCPIFPGVSRVEAFFSMVPQV